MVENVGLEEGERGLSAIPHVLELAVGRVAWMAAQFAERFPAVPFEPFAGEAELPGQPAYR